MIVNYSFSCFGTEISDDEGFEIEIPNNELEGKTETEINDIIYDAIHKDIVEGINFYYRIEE